MRNLLSGQLVVFSVHVCVVLVMNLRYKQFIFPQCYNKVRDRLLKQQHSSQEINMSIKIFQAQCNGKMSGKKNLNTLLGQTKAMSGCGISFSFRSAILRNLTGIIQ